MLLHRDVEHLLSGRTVNVSAFGKGIEHPLFSRIPGENPALDGREVRDNELLSRRWDESCPNELGEGVRDIVVKKAHRIKVTRSYQ